MRAYACYYRQRRRGTPVSQQPRSRLFQHRRTLARDWSTRTRGTRNYFSHFYASIILSHNIRSILSSFEMRAFGSARVVSRAFPFSRASAFCGHFSLRGKAIRNRILGLSRRLSGDSRIVRFRASRNGRVANVAKCLLEDFICLPSVAYR